MRIVVTSVLVDDQEKALRFYTDVLGLEKKDDFSNGPYRWLTVVSPEDPDGTELLLEPNADYPAMKALKADLVRDGIPFTAFQVKDIHAEYERMKALGVEFVMEPTDNGHFIQAVLDDTCGNLIQIFQLVE